MEAHSSVNGYPIENAKIPIIVMLSRISDLKPHEETVPDDLKKLVNALKDNPVLRHPIIADKKTGIVLDGTHRLAAVKKLRCNFIPTALVDYDDPKIAIERWFRLLTGPKVRDFENNIREMCPKKVGHSECDEGLSKRQWYATLEKPMTCLAFPVRNRDPHDMVNDSHSIEMAARNQGVRVAYQDNKDLESGSSGNLVMSTIKLEKSEIIETVKEGKLFPPKSTRHLVPSRPLGGGVPMSWLQESDYSKAQSRYHEYLQSSNVRRLAGGSRVGSRRYLEEVFLFE